MRKQKRVTRITEVPRGPAARLAALCLLAVPVLLLLMDIPRMVAERTGALTFGFEDTGGDNFTAATTSIQGHTAIFGVATVLTLLTAFVAAPAVVLGWRMAKDGAPVLAGIAAFAGVCFVLGRAIHASIYFGLQLFLLDNVEVGEAARLMEQLQLHWAMLLVLVPTIIGLSLWLPLLAGSLYRARMIPLWALLCVIGAMVVLVVLGSSFMTTPIFAGLFIAGLWPAAALVLRNGSGEPAGEAAPAVAAV